MPSGVISPAALRAARESAELSQVAAAAAVGLGRTAVQAYELGYVDPSARALVALARLYRVPVESLCADPETAGAR